MFYMKRWRERGSGRPVSTFFGREKSVQKRINRKIERGNGWPNAGQKGFHLNCRPRSTNDPNFLQCCGSGMFIPDPNFFHPGSASKNLSILTPKKLVSNSRKYDPGCSSRIPDPDFLPMPNPGTESRIRNTDFLLDSAEQHPCFFRLAFLPCLAEAGVVGVVSNWLLGLPWLWSLMLGCVLAAVSPAVVVPCLLSLQDRGFGVQKVSTFQLF